MLKITKITNDTRKVEKSMILKSPGASTIFPINLKSDIAGFHTMLIAKTTPYSNTANKMID